MLNTFKNNKLMTSSFGNDNEMSLIKVNKFRFDNQFLSRVISCN